MQTEYDQSKMWAFHQNENVISFSGAVPRLQSLAKIVFRLARRNGVVNPSVLNIGVGNGCLEELIVKGGGEAFSVDPDERALTRLAGKGVKCYVGKIEDLPFNDRDLDFVVVSEVLEHLDDVQRSKGLAEIYRVLKAGGYVLGTVPYRENLQLNTTICPHCGEVFHRWGHKKTFDLESITQELAVHFQIERVTRTAFVSFSGNSTLARVKSLVRFVLAKSGEPIAVPNIYFVARKS